MTDGTFQKGGKPWNKGKEYPAMVGNKHGFKGDARCDSQFRYESRNLLKHIKECCVCLEEKTSYQMVVHHKDENIKNNELSNLEKMCRSCHMKHHQKDIVAARLKMYENRK